jgi:hypothetical protein
MSQGIKVRQVFPFAVTLIIYLASYTAGFTIGDWNLLFLVGWMSFSWSSILQFMMAKSNVAKRLKLSFKHVCVGFSGLVLAPIIYIIGGFFGQIGTATIFDYFPVFLMIFVVQILPLWLCLLVGFLTGFLLSNLVLWVFGMGLKQY